MKRRRAIESFAIRFSRSYSRTVSLTTFAPGGNFEPSSNCMLPYDVPGMFLDGVAVRFCVRIRIAVVPLIVARLRIGRQSVVGYVLCVFGLAFAVG